MVESVYSAVRPDPLYKAGLRFVFKRLKVISMFTTILQLWSFKFRSPYL